MPERLVKAQVQLHREGKIFAPKVGTVEKFTADEVAEINRISPKALVPVEKKDPEPKDAAAAPKAAAEKAK